jgi:YVTN family beta-propeller protein
VLNVKTTLYVGSLVAITALGGGCGDSKRRSYSTAAAVNSNQNGITPSTSTNAPVTTGTTPNPVPVSTFLKDTLVSSFALQEVVEIDGSNGAVKNRWSTGRGPADVVNTGTMAYVANTLDQNLTVVDRLANNVVTTVDLTQSPLTGISFLNFVDPFLKPLIRPTGVAVTPNGAKIYSANLLNVTAINAVTMQPTKSILGLAPLNLAQLITNPSTAIQGFLASPVPGLGMAKVAATDTHALATCMVTGKVMRIDATNDTVIDYVDVGRVPVGIAIAGNKAYVACAFSQEIWVVDVATGAIRATIPSTGLLPFDVAVNQAQDRIYVANAMSGDVTVIDPAADVIVDTLPGGTSITSLFQQAGLTIPSASQGGLSGLLNGFLQGYTSGLSNPSSFGNLIAGGGSGGLLSPGALINGLLTAFLSYAGFSQQLIGNLSLPGTLSVGAAHDPTLLMSTNAFTGDLAVTLIPAKTVSSYLGLAGAGMSDVSPIWKR